jgi:MFS family permease
LSGSDRSLLLDRSFLKYNTTAALANFVQPIFTLFLPLLALEHGASVFEIGLIGGASSLVYAFMPFVMGKFSDRGQTRTLLIILSLALLSTISILYSFADNPVDLILLRIVEGLGWAAFWPSIDSAVSHDTRVDPSKALAIFNLSWSSTSALGPLVGAFVVVIFSISQVFIFDAIFLVTALLLNLATYPRFRRSSISGIRSNEIDLKDEKTISEPASMDEVSTRAKILKVSPLFYVLSLVLCTISSNTMASFFSPYSHSQGVPTLTIGAIAFTYGAARFTGYLVTSGTRIRNFLLFEGTRIRNIFVLLFFVSLSPLIMLVHSSSGTIYFLSFGIVGFTYSFIYYIAMVAFLAEVDRKRMGAGAGIFETSIGVGSILGPVIAGFVSGNSLTIPFIVPAVMAIPILSALFFVSRSGR